MFPIFLQSGRRVIKQNATTTFFQKSPSIAKYHILHSWLDETIANCLHISDASNQSNLVPYHQSKRQQESISYLLWSQQQPQLYHVLPYSYRMFSSTTTIDKAEQKVKDEDTVLSPNDGSSKNEDSNITKSELTRNEKPSFRSMVRQYGPLFIGTYLTVYVSTVSGFYLGIQSGALDPAYLLSFITSSQDAMAGGTTDPDATETAVNSAKIITEWLNHYSWTQWAVPFVEKNPWAANLAVAWIVTKPTEPIRFGVTVAILPFLARTLGYTTTSPTMTSTKK